MRVDWQQVALQRGPLAALSVAGAVRAPKYLALGVITALFFSAVANGVIASRYVTFSSSVTIAMEQNFQVADLCALIALLIFREFSGIAAFLVGLQLGALVPVKY